jgi:hypothetical protein
MFVCFLTPPLFSFPLSYLSDFLLYFAIQGDLLQ